jgi:hypothetical protein
MAWRDSPESLIAWYIARRLFGCTAVLVATYITYRIVLRLP